MGSDNTAVPGHPPRPAHHYDSPQQQFDAGKLGMWLFLVTEILLFGGLFCAYAVYRANHPEVFIYAHRYLDTNLGAANTVILICSSLTMAWGVRSAQLGRRKELIICLILTLLCACGFLCIKYVEYSHKWKEGLLWGARFAPLVHEHQSQASGEPAREQGTELGQPSAAEPPPARAPRQAPTGAPAAEVVPVQGQLAEPKSAIPPAAPGPSGLVVAVEEQEEPAHGILERPSNVHLFFGIYFTLTGLHGLHVLAGMTAIIWILLRAFRGHFGPDNFLPVDLVGLYWHLVDLVWIYLFPLLYLIH